MQASLYIYLLVSIASWIAKHTRDMHGCCQLRSPTGPNSEDYPRYRPVTAWVLTVKDLYLDHSNTHVAHIHACFKTTPQHKLPSAVSVLIEQKIHPLHGSEPAMSDFLMWWLQMRSNETSIVMTERMFDLLECPSLALPFNSRSIR